MCHFVRYNCSDLIRRGVDRKLGIRPCREKRSGIVHVALPSFGNGDEFSTGEFYFIGKLKLGLGFFPNRKGFRAELFELFGRAGKGKSKE